MLSALPNASNEVICFRAGGITGGRGWLDSCARERCHRPIAIAPRNDTLLGFWGASRQPSRALRGGKKEPRQSSGAEFEGGESSRC